MRSSFNSPVVALRSCYNPQSSVYVCVREVENQVLALGSSRFSYPG